VFIRDSRPKTLIHRRKKMQEMQIKIILWCIINAISYTAFFSLTSLCRPKSLKE